MANVLDSDRASTRQNSSNNKARWRKPAFGEVKCNVDATIFKEQRSYGIGMCLRDANGDYITAKKIGLKAFHNHKKRKHVV